MNLLGMRLAVFLGKTVPLPAPPMITESLREIEVTLSDQGRSGFQLTLAAVRGGPLDFLDYPLLGLPQLQPFSRLVLVVVMNGIPRVLFDGVITHVQLMPEEEPRASVLRITGEDISVMMDMEEKAVEHPAQPEMVIAAKIILSYGQYGLIPAVIPPPSLDIPLPMERTPVQEGTDLDYLQQMASRYGYVFYISPGPLPFTNTAYWGPSLRTGLPQKALSVNLGPETNVDSISFQNNPLAAEVVFGTVQDRTTNRSVPVITAGSLRAPLASKPAWAANQPNVRRVRLRESGLTTLQAMARAQGATEAKGEILTAEGQLDAVRYGDLLRPRELVGVRGAGFDHDGFYYVKRVSHVLRVGQYKQRFSLTREGVGSTTLAVIP